MRKIFNKLFKCYSKHKEIINYLLFGGFTTVINYVIYLLCAKWLCLNVVFSTIISWLVAVMFAYITNRKIVFKSEVNGKKEIVKESVSFVTFRVITGIIDVLIMYLTVDIMQLNDMIMKIFSNIIVIIANYVFSKLFVFREKINTNAS